MQEELILALWRAESWYKSAQAHAELMDKSEPRSAVKRALWHTHRVNANQRVIEARRRVEALRTLLEVGV